MTCKVCWETLQGIRKPPQHWIETQVGLLLYFCLTNNTESIQPLLNTALFYFPVTVCNYTILLATEMQKKHSDIGY